jgi:hypothetical protein
MNQWNEAALDASHAFAAKVRAGMFAPVARHLREKTWWKTGLPKASAWPSSSTSPAPLKAL